MSSAEFQPKRILLECTRTWQTSLHTGIERVVRSIVDVSAELAREEGVVCQPVVYRPRRGFVTISSLPPNERTPNLKGRVSAFLKPRLEQAGLIDLARLWKHRLQWGWWKWQSAGWAGDSNSLQLGANDLLLLLDSSWQIPYWESVQRAQQQGALVGAMIFDLLPIGFPESFTSNQHRLFRDWWDKVYHSADLFFAISQSTYQDVLQFDRENQSRNRPFLGGSFRLGANFSRAESCETVREELLPFSGGFSPASAGNCYLCVGTLSPRKNQAFLLDVFEQLWKTQEDAAIFFIGNRGWNSEAFIQRLVRHPNWQKRLFWRDDLNDAELTHCYQNARGLITASKGEGFNLPIVEALHFGCPVIASDIRVHREVAGHYASYFPLDAMEELVRILKRDCRDQSKPCLADFRWPTWRESGRELLALIQSLTQPGPSRRSA